MNNYGNKLILIEKEKELAISRLRLEQLEDDYKQSKKIRLAKEVKHISKHRIAIKKLDIKIQELEIKHFKEKYLPNIPSNA